MARRRDRLISMSILLRDVFTCFYKMIETQFSKIGIFHSTNGTEYFNERHKNRHLLEVARAVMFTMNIPKYLCWKEILTAVYLINRILELHFLF